MTPMQNFDFMLHLVCNSKRYILLYHILEVEISFLRDLIQLNWKCRTFFCMYSIHLIAAVQVVTQAGGVQIKWRVKRSIPVRFITSMFTVWCCCEGEIWGAGTAAWEQCGWFIVRNCDPFHGAEYWADELTSNSPARSRRLTALNRRGRGGGARMCRTQHH